jgi:hypothetical protein
MEWKGAFDLIQGTSGRMDAWERFDAGREFGETRKASIAFRKGQDQIAHG